MKKALLKSEAFLYEQMHAVTKEFIYLKFLNGTVIPTTLGIEF